MILFKMKSDAYLIFHIIISSTIMSPVNDALAKNWGTLDFTPSFNGLRTFNLSMKPQRNLVCHLSKPLLNQLPPILPKHVLMMIRAL